MVLLTILGLLLPKRVILIARQWLFAMTLFNICGEETFEKVRTPVLDWSSHEWPVKIFRSIRGDAEPPEMPAPSPPTRAVLSANTLSVIVGEVAANPTPAPK